MQGRTILLGVTGGIAVYKAALLASRLSQAGADVHVLMSANATKFVTPLTFQALTRNRVYTDTFAEENPHVISHIDLADRADLFLLVPATANVIGKMATGIADDMLLTTWMATHATTMIAPAMNGHMLEQPAVQKNIETLRERGVRFIEPGVGQLACGYVGKGRLAEPEEIFAAVEIFFQDAQRLQGQRVLITAGGTREALDPVRYLGNRSSGKMGHALAIAAAQAGAHVQLVTTVTPPRFSRVQCVEVESALQMRDEVMKHAHEADVIIMCAAVADYRPRVVHEQKRKKQDDSWTVEFIKNPDILAELGNSDLSALLIGFAAETENVEQNALEKLHRKKCDLLVANDVSEEGAGFSSDENRITVYNKQGRIFQSSLESKQQLAEQLVRLIAEAKGL